MPPLRTLVSLAALLVASPALADADPASGDVTATRVIPAPAEPLYQYLLDLGQHEGLWPEGCTSKWQLGQRRVGENATAKLTYHAGPMNRRRTVVLHEAKTGRRIELDHEGAWGWVTGWTLTEVDGGTSVELTSWIQPPPWPFKRAYFNKVQPAWTTCHEGALAGLEAAVRGGIR